MWILMRRASAVIGMHVVETLTFPSGHGVSSADTSYSAM